MLCFLLRSLILPPMLTFPWLSMFLRSTHSTPKSGSYHVAEENPHHVDSAIHHSGVGLSTEKR